MFTFFLFDDRYRLLVARHGHGMKNGNNTISINIPKSNQT